MDTNSKLYVSTTFVPDKLSVEKALIQCGEVSVSNVELGANHIHENSFSIITKYNFDFLVHNYFPVPEDDFVVNIASEDQLIREKSINHIKNAIDFCCDAGCGLYTFHPGFTINPISSGEGINNYDFKWGEKVIDDHSYEVAINNMYKSLGECVNYASKSNVRIAIETEGSFRKSEFLLMQRPEEYEKLFEEYEPEDLGLNLNIGHLNLAASAFGFSRRSFVALVADYVVAMEMSHNDGQEDQHLPLTPDAWYWPIIFDERFNEVYKIMEYRNTGIQAIVENMNLFRTVEYDL